MGGTQGDDTIGIRAAGDDDCDDDSSEWGRVEVVINGTRLGRFTSTGRIVVFGQARDD